MTAFKGQKKKGIWQGTEITPVLPDRNCRGILKDI
jgi:hypothetical protein